MSLVKCLGFLPQYTKDHPLSQATQVKGSSASAKGGKAHI